MHSKLNQVGMFEKCSIKLCGAVMSISVVIEP